MFSKHITNNIELKLKSVIKTELDTIIQLNKNAGLKKILDSLLSKIDRSLDYNEMIQYLEEIIKEITNNKTEYMTFFDEEKTFKTNCTEVFKGLLTLLDILHNKMDSLRKANPYG